MGAVEAPSMLTGLLATESTSGERPHSIVGIVTGTLIGFKDNGRIPLVVYPGQPGNAAKSARSVVDLHGAHIGLSVVLMFENADPCRPIVMGWLREPDAQVPTGAPGSVELEADGERLLVCAKEQLVLRCGKASITLTKAGKVIVRGAYIVSRSTGVNRVQGGTVHLN